MNFLRKTLGGLKGAYYFRHFVFGAIISFIFIYISRQNPNGLEYGSIIFFIINALLYPYARFVYEQLTGFIMGENVFFVNAIVMLMAKIITMCVCWIFSIFIAPLGLAYLYYHHSKAEKQS
ncbi:hypothetical protein DOH76_23740 [Salmonella enterica subsp. enterica serovar Oranienburg]|uniref:Uncharacterized protein n=1 Tax=Salmonella diarizonae TaxID=59204 RepID=A0A5Y1YF64_SALDZ|nr:hypothetical protein [Salmonella enterica subsp. enterica serovar Oranienburg]ECC3916785.1 hypothetical protein [Salmonella enterica subsp. diarizonae]EDR7001730.1 hypothetical protein [Salmonella enterica subsp. enterica serovar Java]EHN1697438.1 hypothetical protein [Salmonella enterica subsp. enterica serovar Newport]EIU9113137.1 hypothetical protein [Salmonella enterica]